MDSGSGFSLVLAILGSLVGLCLIFWSIRLLWEIMRSSVALAILIPLFALTVSSIAPLSAP
jgi:hypothetical protein